MLNQQNTFYQHLFFRLIVLSSVGLFTVNLFIRLHIIPFHAVEIGGIEINVIDGIIKILSGNYLYTDPAAPPYDIIQYSPLYYYLVAGISKMFNISSGDPQSVYIITRCVALTANISTVVIVFLIAGQFRLSKANSLLAGIFSFIILTQHYYSRGDSLYCLLFFIAVLFFLKFVECKKTFAQSTFDGVSTKDPSERLSAGPFGTFGVVGAKNIIFYLVAFSISSFLCIFTKQSGIIILLTAGLFLLLKGDFRSIGIIAASFLILSLLFLAISGSIGGLDSFYRNVVLGVKNGASLDMIKSFFNDKYFRHAAIWVIIGFYISSGVFKKQGDPKYYYILLLLFSSLLFAFITGFKIGSSLNYFIECFILTLIAVLVYISNREMKFFRAALYCIFFLSILVKTGELFSATFISKFRNDDLENYRNEKRVSEYMLNDVGLSDSDYVYLNFRGYTELFLHGKSILNQKDFNYMVYLYAFPEIDFIPLIQKADQGYIRYIISREPLENVYIFGRHFENFEALKTFGNITIFKYRTP